MSAIVRDLSPVPLPEQKPTNRGRFSDDRQYWEEVHKRRYLQWQGGDSIEDIAAAEGVTYNAIRHRLKCGAKGGCLAPRCSLHTRIAYGFRRSPAYQDDISTSSQV
jgi:hypothetical protein